MVYPDTMMIGEKYYITPPVYDDFDEGLKEETILVEVLKREGNELVLKDIEHDFTFERTFNDLKEYKIKKYE